MKPIQIVGAILLILGIVALAIGGSWMTGHETTTHVGPLDVESGRTERVTFPPWAGIGAIAVGGLLVLYPLLGKKERSPKAG